ncbi:tRNA (guanosine(46)-N7)-methyltransferase TrmB [Mycobacterium sp. 1423905.2]|uniref:tRNA (guanosine(46)-N7)-methyltransferase TrmB n=1 Tax=Mycobacterium sp. 1423905.2 TaxID=1856859 RepID=UPI0007FDAB16|nr:tRNA (guanosine(46)-N7)-methyltransferase TrmB [Mycobacterium sp. 1423905.2]OBJ48271.1 tRNA (guanosine(46)-N7)-methyltransferase TrmB [Mycobacterium sp. 1423905.2]
MGHHGQMHAHPGLGSLPDTPVESGTELAHEEDSRRGYLPSTSFRSRRSALSPAQRDLWERLWPRLGRQAHDEGNTPPLDSRAWFGREAPLVLEIGCGNGASTLAMAQAEPDIDVIAVEIYRRGLAQLLAGIDSAGVSNIRLIRGNAVDVLRDLLAPRSLTGVRVFFPDPWPKARHHKRRLLQPATVAMIADRLLPGGVLHAATDHSGYAEHIAQTGDAEPQLVRVDPRRDALPISVVRPVTKYETKAGHEGRTVAELIWKRR